MLDFKQKDELLKDRENKEILFHSIVGSQNYGLDNKNSDIDTKAIVLLDFKDIIKKRTYNKDIKWEDNAITSLKDLEEYKKLLVKSNINILETLFSKEYSYNNEFKDEIEELLDNRENIANIDPIRLLKSERGFSFQVYKKIMNIGMILILKIAIKY